MPVKVMRVKPFDEMAGPTTWVYIGREWAGWLPSVFYNPFHIGQDGSRAMVIVKFAEYFYAPEQAWLREQALQLIGPDDTLGCWCKPLACHGDIIAGYVNWKHQEPTLW